MLLLHVGDTLSYKAETTALDSYTHGILPTALTNQMKVVFGAA